MNVLIVVDGGQVALTVCQCIAVGQFSCEIGNVFYESGLKMALSY